MKLLVPVGFLLAFNVAHARGVAPINECAEKVSRICRAYSEYTSDECMDRANKACQRPYLKLPDCIAEIAKTCTEEERTDRECIDHALAACVITER